MKKLLSIAMMGLALLLNAQNQKFTYKFISQSDSTQRKNPVNEQLALVVSKEGSVFYSEDKVKSDSILKAKFEAARGSGNFNIDMRGMKVGRFGTVINKEYPSYKTLLKNRIGVNMYEFEEVRKPDWKITSEKDKIGEWNVQKATANYLGREWEAWFTTDIPIQDGPYVFQGLPGLIVKIADQEQDYTFILEGVKNNFTIADLKIDKVIKLNYEKYRKAFQDDYLDPGKDMKMMMAGSGAGGVVTSVKYVVNGKEVDAKEMERKQANEAKNRKLTNLNPIDKELLKK